MKRPFLSVIVPVYNVEAYVEECLKSILSQTFKDFELLLVDDGSSDKSGEICDRYADNDDRIRVIHQKNNGVSSARNTALTVSSGEWITFVDSDDYVEQDYFEQLIAPIRTSDEIDFTHGGCTNCDSTGHQTGIEQQYSFYHGDDKAYLLENYRGLLPGKMFRSSIIREHHIAFDEKVKVAEDLIFTTEYLTHVREFAFVENTGYLYRRHSTSVTHSIVRDYSEALRSYRHQKDAFSKFVEHYALPESSKRNAMLAREMFNTILLLYRRPDNRSERIARIRGDFDESDFRLLGSTPGRETPRTKWGGGKKLLIRMLCNGYFRAFDTLTGLIFYIKRICTR